MSNAEDAIASRLQSERKDLLDLSLRNPLLNYRPRTRGLEVAGTSSAAVFRALVRERRRLTFLPAPGVGAGRAETPPSSDARAQGQDPTCSGRDVSGLPTVLLADSLQARLLAISYAARASLEETGVNTLFLALGMLRWHEAEPGAWALRAPLILVPVLLERPGAREPFLLRTGEQEFEGNLSISEKLRADYGIVLPELPERDELEVEPYFEEVAAAVRDRPRWMVERDAIALGFFSFSKFLMYRDLDDANWPEGSRPGDHPILRALLRDGFREPAPVVGDDEPLDRHLAPEDVRHVVDADGSQTLAILDVNRGRNLVIQGPPGTGKSQTITNLIAEAIGRGKSVLFVAEKMAALEVVKRRLDAVRLGDACLELHSHKASKRAVLDQLRRTLGLGSTPMGSPADDLRRLGEARDRLNAYCEAVNTPIGLSGDTPHRAFGALLRLRPGPEEGPLPLLDLPEAESWTGPEFQDRLALVERLQASLVALGELRDHSFRGSRRMAWLPGDDGRFRDRIREARRATLALRDASADLARFLRLPAAGTRASAEVLLRSARWAMELTPWQVQGAPLRSAEWLARHDEVRELLEAGAAQAEIRRRHAAILLPEAWDQDPLEARHALNAFGRRWWRSLSGDYRRARLRLASLCRARPPDDLDDQLVLIDAVLQARRLGDVVHRHEPLAARLFGRRWQGARSNWSALASLGDAMHRFHLDLRDQRVLRGLLDFLAGTPAVTVLETLTRAVETALDAHRDALHTLSAFLERDGSDTTGVEGGLDSPGLSFEEHAALLENWSAKVKDFEALIAFNRLAERCRDAGLSEVVALAESWPGARHSLARVFLHHRYEGLLRRAFRERLVLAEFEGRVHEQAIDGFAALERRALGHHRAWLVREHRRNLPRQEGDVPLALLRREFAKKTRHLPVRQLLARAGDAVRAITPVFLMSPLSVATYLAPGRPPFDLVIFDEASQVKPIAALGALLRARQAVVVGDSRQLPPTRFFDRLIGDAEWDDDEESASDVESILGLFVAQGAPERMLRWHYRSRHESLIAVSNREFYDDRLVVFPSPDADRREAGLVLRHLPETSYDRGGTRTNPGEAEAVARAVMEHARAQLGRPPDARLTLGVAAFSMVQVRAIQGPLERLRADDPACEPFFAPDLREPFFLKNLESVQGDERDVIFISIGYGRTAEGGLTMNFGPLNGEGGERRLNVLITRARVRCEVFTNLTAADIDTGRSRSWGIRALKTFLAFAETGRLDPPNAPETASASEVAEVVRAALADSGYQARPRVGSAGFTLDLAVIDPDRPGRYLLGIACDGPGYHAARSARDRDHLRHRALASLGWRIHRVWSPDWFRDPSGELERLLTAIAESRANATVRLASEGPAV
ncbi:MAG: DUF4011 domain-containing protein [Planctomycetaceae bacterium]|nr:DUF4011 domain-containing protein [Planctomycetaceae bacterium]